MAGPLVASKGGRTCLTQSLSNVLTNDGGEGEYVGFSDTCSDANIGRNITNGRVWCRDKECQCRRYLKKGKKGGKPVDPCYESRLFRDWRFGAGRHHFEKKRGTPIRMHPDKVKVGQFVIVTTRFPQSPNNREEQESQRRIIGMYRIGEISAKPGRETMLIASPEGRVRLRMAEAKELFFWEYYRIAKRKPAWGTGLFRYLDDAQTHRMLVDMAAAIQDGDRRAIVNDLIERTFGKNPPPPASGYSVRRGER